MKWLDRLDSWFNLLPGWLRGVVGLIIVLPIILIMAPLVLAYIVITVPIVAIWHICNPNWWANHPASRWSLDDVRQHAQSLSRKFDENLAKHPDIPDCFRSASELCKELMHLAGPGLSAEAAKALEKRVQVELEWCKGSCFTGLHLLCRRLVELAEEKKAV